MPHSTASDLGVQCLLITLLGVSRIKWVNIKYAFGESALVYHRYVKNSSFKYFSYFVSTIGHFMKNDSTENLHKL